MARKSSLMQEKSERKSTKNKRAEEIMFSNKQKALCKQATDLSVLCGIEFAIIIFSVAGEPFIFGKPDVESVVDRFLQAKQSTECSTSCRMTIEKICRHKKHEKMDQQKRMIIDDKGKGKAIEDNIERSTESFKGNGSERLEKQLTEEIENFERYLVKEINELQSKIWMIDQLQPKISEKDTKIALKMISSTTPYNWLSL
ncbi:unnamed protein product [Withania somnifera]